MGLQGKTGNKDEKKENCGTSSHSSIPLQEMVTTCTRQSESSNLSNGSTTSTSRLYRQNAVHADSFENGPSFGTRTYWTYVKGYLASLPLIDRIDLFAFVFCDIASNFILALNIPYSFRLQDFFFFLLLHGVNFFVIIFSGVIAVRRWGIPKKIYIPYVGFCISLIIIIVPAIGFGWFTGRIRLFETVTWSFSDV